MAKGEQLPRLLSLLHEHRWAALATINETGQAEASMVAYALDEQYPGLYLHLSQLAAHSRNLQHQPEASLVISEADTGTGDPQQLARATLYGQVTPLRRDDEDYTQARQTYLHRLPAAEPLFEFADFHLFRFSIRKVRFVGGFAQAHSYQFIDLEKGWEN